MLLPVPRTHSGAGTADLRVMKISRPGKQPLCRCQRGRRQASGWVAGSRSSAAEAEGGPRCWSRVALLTRGMSAAGNRVDHLGGRSRPDGADTEMSGEGPWLHPCFPLGKFSSPFPRDKFPTRVPFQLPAPSAHPPVPTRSLYRSPCHPASTHGPTLPPALVMGIAMAELVPVSLPRYSHPCTLQQSSCRGDRAELAGIAAEIKSSCPAPKFSLRCKSSKISKLGQAGARSPELLREEGEAKPSRASKPTRTHPNSCSDPAGPPSTAPSRQGQPGSYLHWWWQRGRQPKR